VDEKRVLIGCDMSWWELEDKIFIGTLIGRRLLIKSHINGISSVIFAPRLIGIHSYTCALQYLGYHQLADGIKGIQACMHAGKCAIWCCPGSQSVLAASHGSDPLDNLQILHLEKEAIYYRESDILHLDGIYANVNEFGQSSTFKVMFQEGSVCSMYLQLGRT